MKVTRGSLGAKFEMARRVAAAYEVNVPTTLIRQNIREIATLASGEIPSRQVRRWKFRNRPNAELCATERMASALFPSTGEVGCLQMRFREKEMAVVMLGEQFATLTTKLEELGSEIGDAFAVKERLGALVKSLGMRERGTHRRTDSGCRGRERNLQGATERAEESIRK